MPKDYIMRRGDNENTASMEEGRDMRTKRVLWSLALAIIFSLSLLTVQAWRHYTIYLPLVIGGGRESGQVKPTPTAIPILTDMTKSKGE